jgi:hypothetical protein
MMKEGLSADDAEVVLYMSYAADRTFFSFVGSVIEWLLPMENITSEPMSDDSDCLRNGSNERIAPPSAFPKMR